MQHRRRPLDKEGVMSHRHGALVPVLVLGLLALSLAGGPAAAQSIKLGNLVDLTGPTSDQGKDIGQGRIDAIQYFNERGGVNGKKIELVSVEYGFQPPRAVAAYKKFIEDDKVILVLGYGTPDTEALRPYITKDKIPYISGSYSGHLTDPRQTPFNFPGGIDYTSQIRIFLNYVKETWKDTSRKPRVAFIFADNAYGRAPIESGRKYAAEIGVDLVDEEVIPTVLTDATSQLLTMKKKDPDFAYINTNTQWAPVVLKDSYKLGLKVKYVINNYGIDERTPGLAGGEAAEGVMGIQDVAYWGDNVPGMKTLMEFHTKHHPNDTHAAPYMRGWLQTLLAVEGIKRAGTTLTGDAVKKGLETLKEFDTWGITPPFSFTNEDHRPTTNARLVVIKGGKVLPVREVSVNRDMAWIGK
jgi:branched-chain amino acid transport system substrate-binding protein